MPKSLEQSQQSYMDDGIEQMYKNDSIENITQAIVELRLKIINQKDLRDPTDQSRLSALVKFKNKKLSEISN